MRFARKAAGAVLVGVTMAMTATAHTLCGAKSADAPRVRCVAGMSSVGISHMQQAQQERHWQWPAVFSMLLQPYAIRASQEHIAQILGSRDAAPNAQHGGTLDQMLAQDWKDDEGRPLELLAQKVPAVSKEDTGAIAPEVLHELQAGRPLILLTASGPLLLVQVVYDANRRQEDIAVKRLVVLDPGMGMLRSLRESDGPVQQLVRVSVARGAPAMNVAAAAR